MKGTVDGPAGLGDGQADAYGVSLELSPRPVLRQSAGLDESGQVEGGPVEGVVPRPVLRGRRPRRRAGGGLGDE